MFDGNPSLPQRADTDASNNLIVLSADFTHGGTYTCSATNSLSSLYTDVIVNIKYPETCSTVKTNISDVSGYYVIDPDGEQGEAPFTVYCNMSDKGGVGVKVRFPLVTITPQTQVTESGREVQFTCKVNGKSNPEVKWSRLNGSLPESRSILSEEALMILNVTTDDSGSYVCTATNIMGTNSSAAQLQVYTALKFITRPPPSVVVYIGQILNLSCSASSDLQPTISWIFDGISSLPVGAAIDASDNVIFLFANFTHGGIYTCSATNSLSSLHTNATVSVKHPETCSTVKASISDVSGDYVIDPDGNQGEAPFTVYCNMTDKGGVGVTFVSHDSENRTHVKGFEDRGSYVRNITYRLATLAQLKALTGVSTNCEQFIKYECHASAFKFKNRHALFSWWVSVDGEEMTYWGGGTERCACGVNDTCFTPGDGCNCDTNDYFWLEDSGLLTNKAQLPVSQLRFGETGSNNEEGYHTLGKLKCYGLP
ncbi:uncharacterized protein LOC144658537 [Oculina patagonica]